MTAPYGGPTAPTRSAALRWLAAVAAIAVTSGCAWGPRYRDVRRPETLELESLTVTLPDEPGWRVHRDRDVGYLRLELAHSTHGALDGEFVVSEWNPRRGHEAQDGVSTRDELLARLRKAVGVALDDPEAPVTEVAVPLDPRLGPSAVQLVVRGEDSEAKAGLLVKRVAAAAGLEFASLAPGRVCGVWYVEAARRGPTAADLEARWRALTAGVSPRAADAAAVRSAAHGEFPKSLLPGYARRSLTLPAASIQLGYDAERALAPGGWDDAGRFAVGIRDRIQYSAPGFVHYALGEPEAIVAPEVAIGAGWSSYAHDAERGSVWGGALSVRARRRLGSDVAALAGGFVEGTHESRTGRNHLYGGGAAGVVWDVHPAYVSLGLEAGYSEHDDGQPTPRLTWIGGRTTPIVAVHLSPVDLGLTGGVGWDGSGEATVLAGFSVLATF